MVSSSRVVLLQQPCQLVGIKPVARQSLHGCVDFRAECSTDPPVQRRVETTLRAIENFRRESRAKGLPEDVLPLAPGNFLVGGQVGEALDKSMV